MNVPFETHSLVFTITDVRFKAGKVTQQRAMFGNKHTHMHPCTHACTSKHILNSLNKSSSINVILNSLVNTSHGRVKTNLDECKLLPKPDFNAFTFYIFC